MAPQGLGELVVIGVLVATIWLVGAVYIKIADYFMQSLAPVRHRPTGANTGSSERPC